MAYTRPQAAILTGRLKEPRRFLPVVVGPSQVGKTTLAQQVIDASGMPARYASADEPTLRSLQWIEQQWDAGSLEARDAGVWPSMGSLGDCCDNALCESFFATLECELLDRHVLHTRDQARRAVFEFIEGWYNPHRRHSALQYASPARYEVGHAYAA